MLGSTSIKICNAEISREDKKFTKMDLYASIIIGKQHYETKICKGTSPNPIWNETFKVNLAKEKEISVEIWNGAQGDDVLIAEGKIAVGDISKAGKSKISWINLFFEKKPAGKILLEIHFDEQEKKPEATKKPQVASSNGEIDELKQQLKDLQFEVNLIKGGDKNSSLSLNSKVAVIDNMEYNEPVFKPKNFTLQSQSLANYYTDSKITGILQKALEELGRVRPQFPISFIGQYLIANDVDKMEWDKNGGVDPKREVINHGVGKSGVGEMKNGSQGQGGLGMGIQGMSGLGGMGMSASGMTNKTGGMMGGGTQQQGTSGVGGMGISASGVAYKNGGGAQHQQGTSGIGGMGMNATGTTQKVSTTNKK